MKYQVARTLCRAVGIRQVVELPKRNPVGEVRPTRGRHSEARVDHWEGWVYGNPGSRRDPQPRRLPGEYRLYQDAGKCVWDAVVVYRSARLKALAILDKMGDPNTPVIAFDLPD